MSSREPTVLESVTALSPGIGAILRTIFTSKRGKVPQRVAVEGLLGRLPDDCESRKSVLHGALAILYGMGVVHLEGDAVKATSRNAGFFIGSLSKFLDQSVPATNAPADDRGDYSALTRIYETARGRRDQEVAVNQDPLHHRHIVNLVIKARMTRHWQPKDVYLHEYHHEWKQYHLIGGSPEEGSPEGDLDSDRDIAEAVLRERLHLRPDQYELDPSINPDVKSLEHISETNGAHTRYTYRLFVVQKIQPKLSRDEHLREDRKRGPFRWFTIDEIQSWRGSQGEPIIFSTPDLMKELDLDRLPVCASEADDVRQQASILKELGNRFTRRQLAGVALLLVVLLSLQLLLGLVTRLEVPDATLGRLADWAQLLSGVLAPASALGAVFGALAAVSRE